MKKKLFITIGILAFIGIFGFVYCFFSCQKYHYLISTEFSSREIPLVHVNIQGQKYLLKMDLGSKSQLVLHKPVLDILDTMPHEALIVRDVEGRSYETPAYILPSIEVGGLVVDQVVVKEENLDYIMNTTISESSQKSIEECIDASGTIGGALFSDKNLLLDFDYSVIYVSNDMHELKELGYDWKEFVRVPYASARHFIILKFDTDFGEVRLALDTGCTISLLRSSFIENCELQSEKYGVPFVTSSRFEIGGKDFGPMDLYLYNISPELLELDGMLGMDFLMNHVVYIDREHKQVYVQEIEALSN